jgi:GT2 family glycosyltransferase/glycosyltransferase involved in cell wall biosynthesis
MKLMQKLWLHRQRMLRLLKIVVCFFLRLYRRLPIPARLRCAIKEIVFTCCERFIFHSACYQLWVSNRGSNRIGNWLKAQDFFSLYPKAPMPPLPGEEEWRALKRPGPLIAAESAIVDIIIPVYKGYTETLACIYSVLAHTQQTPYELIVINDASPDSALTARLRELQQLGLFTLYENDENLGFVHTVNRGMALHGERDVLLLNADTEVYNDWLDRIRTVAIRHASTATVTPLSNNAEICSYPFFVKDNYMALETSYQQLDAIAAQRNEGASCTMPTAVGFCMYIKRQCLNDIGLFDAEAFGRGYGEENDFCLRATARKWDHVLAGNVFVRHFGGSSFQDEKNDRVKAAMKIISHRYPDYGDAVSQFIRLDPPRRFRIQLDAGRVAAQLHERTILFISHNLGGGTERHIQDMIGLLERENISVLLLRPDDVNNKRLVLSAATSIIVPNLSFDIDTEQALLEEALQVMRVCHIHVHHVIGFDRSIVDFIPLLAQSLHAKYDVTLHDYFTICPRINLIDGRGSYCGEPEVSVCEACVRQHGSMVGVVPVWQWRERFGAFLQGAAEVFVPDSDVSVRMARYFPEINYQLRPHYEILVPQAAITPPLRGAGEVVRVALIGELGPHKGSALILACAKDAAARNLPLQFCIIGNSYIRDALLKYQNVTITGNYKEEEIYHLLEAQRCHFAFFASLWPETYSYTLSIAQQAGLFPVAFDLGAVAARIHASHWGETLPIAAMGDPSQVNDLLLAVNSSAKPEALAPFAPHQLDPHMAGNYYTAIK